MYMYVYLCYPDLSTAHPSNFGAYFYIKGSAANLAAFDLYLRLFTYCFTPYQRLWLYNCAPLFAFHDTLGIRRTYSPLKPPASSRGNSTFSNTKRSPSQCRAPGMELLCLMCDGTDVQADRRSCTYGRAPNAIGDL